MRARRIVSLTVIFCGLATAFSGFSFAAMGRGSAAVLSGVLGLVLVGLGIAWLPAASRPPVVGWRTRPPDRDTHDAPAGE